MPHATHELTRAPPYAPRRTSQRLPALCNVLGRVGDGGDCISSRAGARRTRGRSAFCACVPWMWCAGGAIGRYTARRVMGLLDCRAKPHWRIGDKGQLAEMFFASVTVGAVRCHEFLSQRRACGRAEPCRVRCSAGQRPAISPAARTSLAVRRPSRKSAFGNDARATALV